MLTEALLTAAQQLNEFVTESNLDDTSGRSEVVNPSSQLLHHKQVRQSAAVLHSVGKTKLNFERSYYQTENVSGRTSG